MTCATCSSTGARPRMVEPRMPENSQNVVVRVCRTGSNAWPMVAMTLVTAMSNICTAAGLRAATKGFMALTACSMTPRAWPMAPGIAARTSMTDVPAASPPAPPLGFMVAVPPGILPAQGLPRRVAALDEPAQGRLQHVDSRQIAFERGRPLGRGGVPIRDLDGPVPVAFVPVVIEDLPLCQSGAGRGAQAVV